MPEDAFVGGIIARLTEQKGHRFLFDAMAATPALANMHTIVIGGGDLQAALVRQVDDLGLGARVHLLGPRRDLGDLLAAMDVFVMPSLWEGLPLSLVLAMGAGLPVVMTSVAGIPELVDDRGTGLPRSARRSRGTRRRAGGDGDRRSGARAAGKRSSGQRAAALQCRRLRPVDRRVIRWTARGGRGSQGRRAGVMGCG